MNEPPSSNVADPNEPRRFRLGLLALGVLAVGGLGLWLRDSLLAPGIQPAVPRGRLPESSEITAPVTDRPATGGERLDPCPVPGLPEGVNQKDIVFESAAAPDWKGGGPETGRYRIIKASSNQRDFTPGRWSMAFDLASGGQGAFYRKLGFSARSSRIRWSVGGSVFKYETICPDPGEEVSFEFSARDGQLWLKAKDGTVLTLEPYADSQVTSLPPL